MAFACYTIFRILNGTRYKIVCGTISQNASSITTKKSQKSGNFPISNIVFLFITSQNKRVSSYFVIFTPVLQEHANVLKSEVFYSTNWY